MGNREVGIWDTTLMLRLTDEQIRGACETDAPTCVEVIELRAGNRHVGLHSTDDCRLCAMIELFAEQRLDDETDIISYVRDGGEDGA